MIFVITKRVLYKKVGYLTNMPADLLLSLTVKTTTTFTNVIEFLQGRHYGKNESGRVCEGAQH